MTTSSWGEGTPLTPPSVPVLILWHKSTVQLQWFHTSFLGPKWKVVLPLFIPHSSFLIVLALNRQTRLGYNDFGAFGRPAAALARNGPPSKQSLFQTSNDLILETDEILNTFALHLPRLHPNFCYLSRHLTIRTRDATSSSPLLTVWKKKIQQHTHTHIPAILRINLKESVSLWAY